MKKYKKFLVSILVHLVVLFGWGAQIAHMSDEISISHIMQVISSDMKHERTISWQMKNYDKASYLEIRKKGDVQSSIKPAIGEEIPYYSNRERIYTVRLKNLEAGSEYEYRIVVEEVQTDWRSFKTDSEQGGPFKVLIFGDSQSINYEVWGKTALVAWERNKDTNFFVNMGDLVDNGEREKEWQSWFANGGKLISSIPLSPVMGNHEVYGLRAGFSNPKTYLTLFAVPSNGPNDLKRHAYSYDYGDVHFVVLNTQQGELRNWYPDLLEKQKTWLIEDLNNTTKKWKVIFMHRGVWTNGYLNEMGQVFGPVFDNYHVDLVFSGHTHIYSRTIPLKEGQANTAGTVYITTGRSGTKVYPKTREQWVDKIFYNPVDLPNYLVLKASKDSLVVESYKQDETSIDQIEIKK